MCSLVIGGTQFVGKHFFEAAVRRDYEVDLFNRGSKPAPAGVYGLGGERSEAGLNGVLGVGPRWTQWSFLC